MPEKLKRLLKSHEFVHRSLVEHGRALAPLDVARLERERDALFLQLVTFTSSDPRVTLAQVRFLLTSLTAIASDASQAERLRTACLAAVNRLFTDSRTRPTLQEQTLEVSLPAKRFPTQHTRDLLDSMTDRIGIADRDYRYAFSNRANANFYGIPQAEMERLPIASVVGSSVFSTFTKPNLDLCFEGQSISRYVRFHSRLRPRVTSTRLDPIHDQDGTVLWVIVTVRDVSAIPVPSEYVIEFSE